MQLTAHEVLHTFHHDEIALFLGAAFATVGLISLLFLIISRKFDALLFWLGLFALIVPPSEFFDRIRAVSNFVVVIPALFFFRAAGFLRSVGAVVAYVLG